MGWLQVPIEKAAPEFRNSQAEGAKETSPLEGVGMHTADESWLSYTFNNKNKSKNNARYGVAGTLPITEGQRFVF